MLIKTVVSKIEMEVNGRKNETFSRGEWLSLISAAGVKTAFLSLTDEQMEVEQLDPLGVEVFLTKQQNLTFKIGEEIVPAYVLAGREILSKDELNQVVESSFKTKDILIAYLKNKEIDIRNIVIKFGRNNEGNVLIDYDIYASLIR